MPAPANPVAKRPSGHNHFDFFLSSPTTQNRVKLLTSAQHMPNPGARQGFWNRLLGKELFVEEPSWLLTLVRVRYIAITRQSL